MTLPQIDPRPDLYDAAETWSVDQLRAVQLERLQGCVRRAYDGVPHYRRQLDASGVQPRRRPQPRGHQAAALHHQACLLYTSPSPRN